MRRYEYPPGDIECPTRYYLDEARFAGGREIIRNEEEHHEPSTNLA